MNNQIIDFYLKEREPNKSCLMAMHDVILNQDHRLSEMLKYRMPCFIFESKVLCYLWVDKKSNKPYILFVDGHMISNHLLEKGNRKRMKILDQQIWKNLAIGDRLFGKTRHSYVRPLLDTPSHRQQRPRHPAPQKVSM